MYPSYAFSYLLKQFLDSITETKYPKIKLILVIYLQLQPKSFSITYELLKKLYEIFAVEFKESFWLVFEDSEVNASGIRFTGVRNKMNILNTPYLLLIDTPVWNITIILIFLRILLDYIFTPSISRVR